jgi:Protein of unknown function (DUF4058)
MPLHDWTRVTAGVFHAFHNAWITELQRALNAGVLPADYYALGEQWAGEIGPDVLTLHLQRPDKPSSPSPRRDSSKPITLADQPPQTRITQQAPEEAAYFLSKRRAVVIRHISGDRVIAVIEIVSPGNKLTRVYFEQLLNKILGALRQGCHLLVVDLLPPGTFDPDGLHGKIWEAITGETFQLPAPDVRVLAAYRAAPSPTAYVELPSVGDVLQDMPLFLSEDQYVAVPLEETYQSAFTSMPAHLRQALD